MFTAILVMILIIIIELLVIIGLSYWIYNLYKRKGEKRIMTSNQKVVSVEEIKHELEKKKDINDEKIKSINTTDDYIKFFNQL